MTMVEIDIDEEALALAAEALGTHTAEDTVNAALWEVAMLARRGWVPGSID
ncbi:hypothetical protein [Streptomyces sp. NPDC051364]|uniref:hypothetical protein n=1 Tax=Streptomyces sp. NPDC051364 TaxID=3155799 RepID=UPI0034495619